MALTPDAGLMQKMKSVKLNTGHDMPLFGLGTWKSEPGKVSAAVGDALDLGYKLIDCAHVYGNEKEVGEALGARLKSGQVKREDLFIVSKLWNTFHSADKVLPALKTTLENLGLEYVDLYLIHWPMGYKEDAGTLFPKDEAEKTLISTVDYTETWVAMEKLVGEGLVRSIGVSNFNKDQIERVLAAGTVVPAANQVECHPQLAQDQLIAYCKGKGIEVMAYSPLGSPDRPWAKPSDPLLMEHPEVLKIAGKHGRTAAQVLIAYQLHRNVIVIPKSVTQSRILSNLQSVEVELDAEDMAALKGLDCNGRVVGLEWLKDHPHYPFSAPF